MNRDPQSLSWEHEPMNSSELRTQVWQEIQQVPEDKLVELYHLIHTFRLQAEPTNQQPTLQFAGCWNDLPDDTYSEFLDDISLRKRHHHPLP
jgi:hypothetical protein